MDDAYRSFFRPDEPDAPAAAAAPAAPLPAPVEPEAAPQFSSPSADTGRLFRSRGADAVTGALPAVSAHDAAQLRTLSTAAPAPVPAAVAPVDTPAVAASAGVQAPPFAPLVDPGSPTPSKEMPEMAQRRRADSGVSPLGVYLIVIGAALVFGFLDSKVGGAGLGWITGIAVLVATVYTALKVRLSDASVAVIAPPIAYGIAAITVGQLGQSRAGGTFIAAANNAFFSLADNWFWVIGVTLVALAIVVVRTRR